jgi:glycerate dehydrogenase
MDLHHPLLKARNCSLPGHSAWATAEARQKIVDVTADSIRGMLEGKPVNVVN